MMYTVCGSGPVDKQGEDGELLCAAVHKHYQGNEDFFFFQRWIEKKTNVEELDKRMLTKLISKSLIIHPPR